MDISSILNETDSIIEKVTSERVGSNEKMYVLAKSEFEEMIIHMKKLKEVITNLV